MKEYIIVDGMRFYETRIVAEKWCINRRTVSSYCRSGKLGLCVKEKGKWYISEQEIKPLSDKQIYEMLKIIIILKNDPARRFDFSLAEIKEKDMKSIFRWLQRNGYIFDYYDIPLSRLPYDVMLTEKGLKLLFDKRIKGESWDVNDMISIASILLQTAQFVVGVIK